MYLSNFSTERKSTALLFAHKATYPSKTEFSSTVPNTVERETIKSICRQYFISERMIEDANSANSDEEYTRKIHFNLSARITSVIIRYHDSGIFMLNRSRLFSEPYTDISKAKRSS